MYIAEIDEFAFGSTEKRVAKNPTSGSLFYTQNGVTFTPAQNQDLTFRLHRASFKHTSGTVSLKNASVPKAHLLSPPFKVTSGSTNVIVKHLNSGLQVGDKVTFSGADSCGGIKAATLNKNGGYAITKTDWSGYSFTADSAATSSAFGGGGKVLASKNIPYSIIQPNVEILQPTDTTVEAQMKATTGKSFAGNETPFIRDTNFNPIKLNGLTAGMSYHLAGCCSPLKGDNIVGIVTAGIGVAVHTIDCKTLTSYQDTPDRWLNISWDNENNISSVSNAKVIVVLNNKPGSLGKVTTLIAKNNGNISNINFSVRKADFFEIIIDIEVRDTNHLQNIIAALRLEPEVSSLERLKG